MKETLNQAALASVGELESKPFQDIIEILDGFALKYGLRTTKGMSKAFEYPWIMLRLGFPSISGLNILDIGSEMSPVPWFLGMYNRVTIVERMERWSEFFPHWNPISESIPNVGYRFVPDERLPFESGSFDLVTSFSVIEHQTDRELAVSEAIRVLKPGGTLAISFDICEPEMGMTPPDDKPLTILDFERLVWFLPQCYNKKKPDWNLEDIPGFLAWHRRGRAVRVFEDPGHVEYVDNPNYNYVVGAAILKKMP